MTCDDYAQLLDDIEDGRLAPAAAGPARLHLETCPACRAKTADSARIRAVARSLGPVEPPARVWAHVAAAVRPEEVEASGPHWRQWLAAAASLALVTSSLAWVGSRLMPAPGADVLARVDSSEQFQLAEAAYQSAIDSLEPITAEADAPVLTEPALVAVQANLDALDRTIGEARGQLTLEPDDEISQELLLSALESKVALLQDTVALLDESPTRGVTP